MSRAFVVARETERPRREKIVLLSGRRARRSLVDGPRVQDGIRYEPRRIEIFRIGGRRLRKSSDEGGWRERGATGASNRGSVRWTKPSRQPGWRAAVRTRGGSLPRSGFVQCLICELPPEAPLPRVRGQVFGPGCLGRDTGVAIPSRSRSGFMQRSASVCSARGSLSSMAIAAWVMHHQIGCLAIPGRTAWSSASWPCSSSPLCRAGGMALRGDPVRRSAVPARTIRDRAVQLPAEFAPRSAGGRTVHQIRCASLLRRWLPWEGRLR